MAKKMRAYEWKRSYYVRGIFAKIEGALDTRIGHEFIVVARTDARDPLGLDKAIERGNLYYKEGADVIFVEAPLTIEEIKEIAKKIPAPLVANMIENGLTPNLSANE